MASNYSADAVQRSNGSSTIAAGAKSFYATSSADNVPTGLVGPATSVVVATGTDVVIPLSAFAYGSGVYLVEANGNGNNDVQAFGRLLITPAGTIAGASGFTNAVSSGTAVYTAGAPPTVTVPYQIIFLGAGSAPTLFQNVAASVTYVVTCTKIANLS